MTRAAAIAQLPREDLEHLVLFYEDVLGLEEDQVRLQTLRDHFRLPPGPAWLLSRLAAADGRLVQKAALMDALPARDHARERSRKAVDVYMFQLRQAVGADAFETVVGHGYRVTPLGRLRVKRALGQEIDL